MRDSNPNSYEVVMCLDFFLSPLCVCVFVSQKNKNMFLN